MDIRRCQSVRIDVRLQNTGPLLKYHSSGSIGGSPVALTDEPPSNFLVLLTLNTSSQPPSIEEEDTYNIEDVDKRASFEVCSKKKKVSNQEAINSFEQIHDEREFSICKKNPHVSLVGGEKFTIWK